MSVERRRRWTVAEKLRLVALSYKAAGGGRHGRGGGSDWGASQPPAAVALPGDDRGATAMAGVPRSDSSPGVTRALVEIGLPNGRRLRVEPDIPAAALRRIIGVLVRRQSASGPSPVFWTGAAPQSHLSDPAGRCVRILIAMKPVDFRKVAEGLAALAREVLQQNPFAGTVLVFRARRADRVKIIAWDGSGPMMQWKRLEDGAFKWPPVTDGLMRLTSAQLSALVEGRDWSRVHALRTRRPTVVR